MDLYCLSVKFFSTFTFRICGLEAFSTISGGSPESLRPGQTRFPRGVKLCGKLIKSALELDFPLYLHPRPIIQAMKMFLYIEQRSLVVIFEARSRTITFDSRIKYITLHNIFEPPTANDWSCFVPET